jgi:hypothetical protein
VSFPPLGPQDTGPVAKPRGPPLGFPRPVLFTEKALEPHAWPIWGAFAFFWVFCETPELPGHSGPHDCDYGRSWRPQHTAPRPPHGLPRPPGSGVTRNAARLRLLPPWVRQSYKPRVAPFAGTPTYLLFVSQSTCLGQSPRSLILLPAEQNPKH